jgi:DNA-binding transcriptional MerR regulator
MTVTIAAADVDSDRVDDYSEPMDTPWTLLDLTERVDAVLRAEGIRQENGQVAEAPNGRTVRWYQSIGLLRRPEQRGRVAFYGRAHLAELVAIKRLQSGGLSLGDVQARLQGLSDEAVLALAALPDLASPVAPDRDSNEGRADTDRTDRSAALSFWLADVSEPAVVDAVAPPEAPATTTTIRHSPFRHSHEHPAGVALVLPSTIDADVAQALLARLVDELVAGGHLPARPTGPDLSSAHTEEDR